MILSAGVMAQGARLILETLAIYETLGLSMQFDRSLDSVTDNGSSSGCLATGRQPTLLSDKDPDWWYVDIYHVSTIHQ